VIRLDKEAEQVVVDCAKQKDAAPFDKFTLRLVPMDESVVLVPSDGTEPASLDACAKWLARWRDTFGDEWVSASTLWKADVVAERTFFRYRRPLIDAGVLEKSGEKNLTRYRLVTHG
jgi:hypothetical protein